MTRIQCPHCQESFTVQVMAPARPSPLDPIDVAVAEWLRTVPPGLVPSRFLIASYRSDSTRPKLSSAQLGRRLGALGYQRHATAQGRYWWITDARFDPAVPYPSNDPLRRTWESDPDDYWGSQEMWARGDSTLTARIRAQETQAKEADLGADRQAN